jgi:hypothetical protein
MTEKFNLIACATARELWTRLAPETPIAPAPMSKFVFRGQANAEWGLVPSVLRDNSIVGKLIAAEHLTAEMQVFSEMRLLDEFVRCCDSLGLQVPGDSFTLRESLDSNGSEGSRTISNPRNWPPVALIGLLALAQHHGVPTRLLDWSRRSHVAAFFAASDAMAKQETCPAISELAVWALDIGCIRKAEPMEHGGTGIGGHYPNVRVVEAPGSSSVNLAAQSGLFTVVLDATGFREKVVPNRALEDEFKDASPTPLWKLTLPISEALRLLELCDLYEISAATLFPGYDGVASYVMKKASSWKRFPRPD